jgi:hypothetical protein
MATTLVVATVIFVTGVLLKGYNAPSTLHGINWIISPIALFLNEGGTPGLVANAVELGVACGFLVATLRIMARTRNARGAARQL